MTRAAPAAPTAALNATSFQEILMGSQDTAFPVLLSAATFDTVIAHRALVVP